MMLITSKQMDLFTSYEKNKCVVYISQKNKWPESQVKESMDFALKFEINTYSEIEELHELIISNKIMFKPPSQEVLEILTWPDIEGKLKIKKLKELLTKTENDE